MVTRCGFELLLEELNICNADMVKWIKQKQGKFNLIQINWIMKLQFADCYMYVFKEREITDRKNGSGEINKTGRTV